MDGVKRVALHSADQTDFPNLALMKLSRYHKMQGDTVEMFQPEQTYDRVYSSKVFTWSPDDPALPEDTVRGGTGYHIGTVLPEEIEHLTPDYSLYNCRQSYGFVTRGCPNRCSWCFVPGKEGNIRANADIDEFTLHNEVVLMDNNVLSHPHGIHQIEKIVRLGLKVDFNQGLEARLIDDAMARLLSKVKWLNPIRLACDSSAQIEPIRKAVEALRWFNATPRRYFCYLLVKDIPDALERVRFLKGIDVDPFAQPYRDPEGTEPTKEQKDFARWVNHKATYKSVLWEDYQG